jgi:hypothetical protein
MMQPGITLDLLKTAKVISTGKSITVLFRDRDRLPTAFKNMLSISWVHPIQFIFEYKGAITHDWWTNGINYNPFGAAHYESNNIGHIEYYHGSTGELGRDNGPASVQHVFNQSYIEQWAIENNIFHRDNGPAVTEILFPALVTIEFNEPGDKNPTVTNKFRSRKTWYHHGKNFNPNGWSNILDENYTDVLETLGANNVQRITNIGTRRISWTNEDGMLHRVDGPAVLIMEEFKEIEKDGISYTSQPVKWHGIWYVHGKELSYKKILTWATRHGILLRNEPCFDRSAFHNTEDEFCYITDFLGSQ